MKRKIAVLMALLALVAVGAAVAENWVKFLETPIGGEFFIDTDSITFIGNNRISVWVKQVHTGYIMFQYFIDFSYRTYLDVSTLYYNRDGTLLFEGLPSLRETLINTPKSSLAKGICKNSRNDCRLVPRSGLIWRHF